MMVADAGQSVDVVVCSLVGDLRGRPPAVWFKLLIIFSYSYIVTVTNIFQLQLQLQLFFSNSKQLQSYGRTSVTIAKQRLVYIRTLYSHNRKQAQAAVKQETTERLRSWSELFMCCVVLNAILFTTSLISTFQLPMLIFVIYFSVTISYS